LVLQLLDILEEGPEVRRLELTNHANNLRISEMQQHVLIQKQVAIAEMTQGF